MGNAHGLDPIQTGDVDDWDAMIDINVKGLLYVSKAIIPQMIEENLVTSSILALLQSLSNGNVYCASHAVDALNQGMRIDLNPFGIRVNHSPRHGRNRI
jgi:NADP-dependent 3-hydroxy acid dehydrogenase YdfG